MKIMIAYDGSESSDAALYDLTKAGLPRTAEAMAVSVADILSMPTLPKEDEIEVHSARVATALRHAEQHADRIAREAGQYAEIAQQRIREYFPEWNVSKKILTGTPSWELIDAASEWDADLVVLGSHGRSGIKRLILGSVSKKVVTDSGCSVRVARRGPEKAAGDPLRVVVAVDGSFAAEQAIRAVGMRVWPVGTEVHLVAVDDGSVPPARVSTFLPRAAEMISGYNEARRSRVEAMMNWGADELSQVGIVPTITIESGDPKHVITSYAEKHGADSIFVGTRDFKSAFERIRLGSVSTAIVTSAHCSVEVVRLSMTED